jgi:hypothetical protein
MILMLAVILLDQRRTACAGPAKQEFVRLRITQRLHGSIDGMQLGRFQPGFVYDVGPVLGALMLAEQWAEPVDEKSQATVSPVSSIRQFAAASAFPWRRRAHKEERALAADRSARRKKPRKNQKGR